MKGICQKNTVLIREAGRRVYILKIPNFPIIKELKHKFKDS